MENKIKEIIDKNKKLLENGDACYYAITEDFFDKFTQDLVKLFAIPVVMKSVCDDCTAYPFDERGKTPLCSTCKDNPKQTVL